MNISKQSPTAIDTPSSVNSFTDDSQALINRVVTDNINIWTSAIKKRSATGRGSNKKIELTGIKKLRELILELAVRGKLVPQDPNEEPASVLLEKIAAEKAQLIKDKKIKKTKALPEIGEDEKPFELPDGWEWDCLSDLCILENGDRSKNYPNKSLLVESGIPFVNAGHLQEGRVDKNAMTFITSERFELLRSGKFINGDILYCLRGSLGKAALVEDFNNGAIASSLIIIRFFKMISSKLMLNYFASPLASAMIRIYDNGTAQPNLAAADLGKFLVPVAPLAEQHRIVAKVDELMGLCDQLEQQTEDSITAHQTLVETLLAILSNSETPAAFNQNWTRITAHFDTLFTTEHSIDQLKQTILQLAVMGKLVPQNPSDEPASVLLEKIAAEKEQLIKDKKIKKQKSLPEVAEDEKPFDLPNGWEWVRLGNYSHIFSGNAFKSSDFSNEGGVKSIKITNAGVGELIETDSYLPVDYLEKFKAFKVVKNDLLLALTRPYISDGLKISICPQSYHNSLLNQRVAAIRPYSNPAYVYLNLRSPYILNTYKNKFGGNGLQPNLKMSDVTELVLALPPLAEQHRIVTKVDELMALCDQLKVHLNDAQTNQLHLADAIVEQAVN